MTTPGLTRNTSAGAYRPTSLTGLSLWLIVSVSSEIANATPIDTVTNLVGMHFVSVPAGSFRMGTKEADRESAVGEMPEPDRSAFRDEQPQHEVRFTSGFLLGQTEVTQGQWLRVMENRPGPEEYWDREDWRELPAVSVSWRMAERFVEELGRMDPVYRYRLPTEAEWEYAARGGRSGLRPVPAEDLGRYAWFIENSADEPHPVATRKANDFGLHDMLGNAWEWVGDWYSPDTYGDQTRVDPAGPEDGRSRVRRGGSYHCPRFQTRPGYRAADPPDTRYSVIGFRVIAEPKSR